MEKIYTFKRFDIEFPELERIEINGVRHYIIVGDPKTKPMVSVTSVLSHAKKESLQKWRNKVGDRAADNKMNRTSTNGTAFHSIVENYLQNKEVEFSRPLLKMFFNKLKPTLHRINNIYCIEQQIYSKILGVAGTPDIIAEFDGQLSIIDTKTSDMIKPKEWIESYFIQCCLYSLIIYELTGVKVKQIVIMMVSRDMEVEVFIEKFDMKYIKKFKKQLDAFKLDNQPLV